MKIENQILNVNSSVAPAALNTKTMEIENRILKHVKWISTPEFDIFSGTIFDKYLKQAKSAAKLDLDTAL